MKKKLTMLIVILFALAALVVVLLVALEKSSGVAPDEKPDSVNYSQVEQPGPEIPSVTQQTLEELQAQIDDPTLVVSEVNAKKGEQVDLAVTVVSNPGILGMTATLSFDESVMSLVSAEEGEAFEGVLEMTSSATLENGCVFLWDGLDIEPDQISDGEILHLKFQKAESAPVGKYTIALILDDVGTYDRELSTIDITAECGYISVYE
jgi:hypothetical protein